MPSTNSRQNAKSLTDERTELEPLADQLDELCAEQDEIEDDHEAYERAQFEYENKREAIDQIEDAREELYRTAWEAARLERQLASEFGDLNEQIAEQREIKDETEDAHDRYVRNEAEAERVDDRRERVIELYKDIETAERERRAAESELRRVKAKFDADRHAELDDRVDCLDSRETQLTRDLTRHGRLSTNSVANSRDSKPLPSSWSGGRRRTFSWSGISSSPRRSEMAFETPARRCAN